MEWPVATRNEATLGTPAPCVHFFQIHGADFILCIGADVALVVEQQHACARS